MLVPGCVWAWPGRRHAHFRLGIEKDVEFAWRDFEDLAELSAEVGKRVGFPALPPADRGAVDAELLGEELLGIAQGFPAPGKPRTSGCQTTPPAGDFRDL
jgi:hypothetical protein